MIHILFVDDEPSYRDTVKQFLEASGECVVDTLSSAREALASADLRKYDAIVSDYEMPGLNGISFLKTIRGAKNPVPFILFTGKGREEIVIQALDEGADSYVQKGGEPKALYADLFHKIRTAVERRTAVEALRVSERNYREIFDSTSEAIIIDDAATGKIIDVNATTLAMYGYDSKEQLLAGNIGDLSASIPPWDEAEARQRIQRCITEGPQVFEWRAKKKNGELFWTEVSLRKTEIGGSGRILAVVRDITGRKQAEDALKASEQKYRVLADAAEEIIYMIDRDDRVVYVNRYGLSLLKKSSGEVIGKPRKDLFSARESDRQYQNIRQVFATAKPLHIESKVPMKYCDTWQDTVLVPLTANDGSVPVVMGLSRDITEQKRTLEALRESEEKYRILVERVNEGIYIYQGDRFVFANTKVSDITGYSTGEILSMPFIRFVHPDDQEKVRDITERRKRGEAVPESYDCRIIRKDGTTRHVGLAVSTIHYNGALAALGCARDITGRIQALEELRFNNVIHATQQETSPEAILIVNENGRIVRYNQQFLRMWGIPNEVVSPRVDEIAIRYVLGQLADPDAFLARIRYLYEHKDERSFEEILLKDGRVLERHSSPMLGDDGRYYGRVWYFQDITDRKRAEEALRIANKKLTLLSGITRHDIRNQTLSLSAYLDLSRQYVGDSPEMKEYISREEQIVKTIERQILFTREYEKLGASDPVWQDIHTVVSEVVREMDLTGIDLEIAFLKDAEIFADPLLRNVLHNLIDNSLRHGGESLNEIRFFSHESEDGLVIVCEDDGAGIGDDDKEMIFYRGFGKNTGFGLFFIREILDITGISIRETGRAGQGARFEITVPRGAFRFTDTGI